MPTETAARKLEIRKYPNRRYYDTTHSRHLTLEEIRSLIQQGFDITVTDAKTGEDITAQLLTQIILELDTAKLVSFPVPLLVRLIQMNDPMVKDFIEKYFNQALKSFLDYQRQAEEQVRKIHGLPATLPSAAAWTEAMIKPFVSAFGGGSAPPPSEPPPPPPGKADSGDLRELIRDLQNQVAALQAKRRKKTKAKAPQARRKP